MRRPKGFNCDDIADFIYAKHSAILPSRKGAGDIVKDVFNYIFDTLRTKKTWKILIRNFGFFERKTMQEGRVATHPVTKEKVVLEARDLIRFRMSVPARNRLNEK